MERDIFRIVSGEIAQNYVETAFPQNFHTKKLGEITVFYAVILSAEFVRRIRARWSESSQGS